MCAFAAALLSCTTEEVAPEVTLDYASGQNAEVTVSPNGGEIILAFVSSEDWLALTVENWFEFEKNSGKAGNNKIAVKVDPNITGNRTGIIRIEAGEKTLPFTITQDVSDHVSAFEKEFEIDANGGSATLSFTTTNVWTATTEAEWLTLSATEGEPGSTAVTATAGQNTEEARTATVIVTCGEEKVEFTIYQDFVEIEEWTLLGTGKYREDFFAGIWALDNEEVDVLIYENIFTPGTYKIENMFASALEACFGSTLAQIEAAGYYKYVPTDIIIVTANGQAFIDDQPTGIIDLDDDPDWAGEYMIGTLQLGSIKDGVITFPTKGLLLSPPAAYAEGNGYYSNTSGKFRIILPGYEAPEDSQIVKFSYEDFLGNWVIGDNEWTISEKEKGVSYYIENMPGSESMATRGGVTKIVAQYDAENGEMYAMEQEVATYNDPSSNNYGQLKDYFSGYFSQGSTNYRNYPVNGSATKVFTLSGTSDGSIVFTTGSCDFGSFIGYSFHWLIQTGANKDKGNKYNEIPMPTEKGKRGQEATEAYKKWLGTWKIGSSNFTISKKITNESYKISGSAFSSFNAPVKFETATSDILFVFGQTGETIQSNTGVLYDAYTAGLTSEGYVDMGDSEGVIARFKLAANGQSATAVTTNSTNIAIGVYGYSGSNGWANFGLKIDTPISTFTKVGSSNASVNAEMSSPDVINHVKGGMPEQYIKLFIDEKPAVLPKQYKTAKKKVSKLR